MLANRVFFSFLELTDPTRHRDFNEYHQLDHRPENLALPGVIWGDRWVRPLDCAEASTGTDADLGRIQYVAMYWFAEPLETSMSEWVQFGTTAFESGRKPDTDYARREVGFFRPIKGYVNPRVLVSADALPFRPVQGLHVTYLEVLQPHTALAERAFAWFDRIHIPDLLTCPGVAGAWTFTGDFVGPGSDSPVQRRSARLHLLYLDKDPLEVMAGINQRRKEWDTGGRIADLDGVIEERLATPLRPIEPWQWKWFD